MKKNTHFLKSSMVAAVAILLFVFNAHANEPFHVRWTMDYTQAGVSDHANFTPSAAALAGGPNTFTLPTVYSGGGGANVVGYIIRPWPVSFSASRYMEFTFTANSFKYNISSIGFRLRRSPNGPNSIKVRTSMDGFSTDLNAFVISNNGTFNTYNIPVSYNNLSSNSFSIRIYAYNSVDIYGTLWFDEISVNGDVLAIVLPVDITYFKGLAENGRVALDWETGWEKNAKEFVVERSMDMKAFTPIGTVAASGETTGRTSYAFIDNDPAAGNNYYRLKLIDKNADFTTCKPIAVFNPQSFSGMQVTPNPASSRTIIITAPNSHEALLNLYNKSGVAVPFRRENGSGGRIFLTPHEPLASGIYFVVYVKNGQKEQLKVLVP
ncbi:Por secretion system C-terminal sorting domain-containing protein [Dyadobacter soli]|uniref:Por secretion system C-terminal sorting domain-containing protein n=1 Tax=Dyadobacter soli TaxID=659014 RepID=A0A1G7IJK0_9BACT|nr:T9SS type A sorting domain-containing protein [Dyadobacter soli]SDF12706.1 Por secretion system C-terminal sorting domain-containing protein [Dyadobacter soli]